MIKYQELPEQLAQPIKDAVAEFEKIGFETNEFLLQDEKTAEFYIYVPQNEKHFEEKYNPEISESRKKELDDGFEKFIETLEKQGITGLLINGRLKEGGHLVLLTQEGFLKSQDKINQLIGGDKTKH